MPIPENPRSPAMMIAELADVQSKLEIAEGNENQIECTVQHDKLLEFYDELEAEISSANPSQPNPQ
jgi:hypothetical protein